MTSNRFGPRSEPLRYDPSRAFVPFTEISRTELITLNDRLEAARGGLLLELESGSDGGETAFVELPERMLADYQRIRGRSALGRILGAGKRLRDAVDRIVVLAAGSDFLGARALFDAGCHPYHNELSRGDRGGRPRIYFAGDRFDNDAVQGLLDLLCHTRLAANVDERWAVILINNGGNETAETAAVAQCLLAALCDSCGGDEQAMAELIVPADGPGGPFAMFSAAGLLPAAVMGLDIVRLLRGAAMMNERFRTAPPGDNPALDHAAVAHVIESRSDSGNRRVAPWSAALESAARWCERLSTNHTAGPLTNLIVETVRRDRLVVPSSRDGCAELAGKSFPELQSAAIQSAGESCAAERIPTAELILPAIDESTLGQFFQMMMLATAIEERLRSDIPDGQTASQPNKIATDRSTS